MKIRTQFTLLLSLFGLLLLAMVIFLAFTSQQADHLLKQEEVASRIEQGINNLSYIAGDYVMYGEDQQRKRWEDEFNILTDNISSLEPSNPEQQTIVSHIKDDQARLQAVFTDVAATIGKSTQPSQVTTLSPAFMQVAWSRVEVQNQSIEFEAALLSKKLRAQADQLKQTNLILMFSLTGIFGISLLSNSLLIRRRILRSIAELHAGTMIVGSGNLDFTILVRQNDEIGELSRAFNQMAADLKKVTASKSDLESEIEERRRAEDALRRSEAHLQAVLDNSPDAIFLKDRESRLLLANPATLAIVGKPSEAVLGKTDAEIYDDPATGRTIMENDQRILASGKMEVVEENLVTPGGTHTYLSTKAPYQDAEGNIIGIIGTSRDITVRKQAEERIRRQEQELRLVMDTVPALISHIGKDFRYMRVNKGYEDWFGLSQQDVEGRFVWEVIGKAAWNLSRKRLEQAMSGKVVSYEEKMPYQHGGYRWVYTILVPDCDETGNVQGIVALVTDITERKQAEEVLQDTNEELQVVTEELRLQNEELMQARSALEESQERLDFVMNACHIGAWELNIDTKMITRSLEHDRLYGYSTPQHEWSYERWFKHIVPEDRDKVEASIQKSIQTQGSWDCEFRILSPDGQMRWIWALGNQRRDANGVACRMAGVVQDVTVRRQAEETVQKNEAMLRAILEQMPSGVTVRDAHTGALILFNARIEELLGDLVSIPKQFIHTDGHSYESEEWPVFRSMVRGEMVEAEEIERECSDGSRITLSVSSAPVRDTQGRIIMGVGIFQDITERKQAEEQLRKYARELADANEDLRRFNRAAVGRELRMIELKKQVNALCLAAGQPPRYDLEFEKTETEGA